MDNKLLTVGITSYKRLNELKRCIDSVKTKYIKDVEIIVSEDHSSLSKEVCEIVNDLKDKSNIDIIFYSNEVNLGYDRNLGAIIKRSNGKYIFFLSDDDAIYPGFLDVLIEKLKKSDEYGLLYSPFVYLDSNKLDRNHGKNEVINHGFDSASKYIYDSILFSGLIFKKEYIKDLDSNRFLNMNYFQVYMFLYVMSKYDSFYFSCPSVMCISDGENAYGISESSGGNKILADRKSVKSNLEFNKTLIKVIKMFDEDYGADITDSFAKQYSLHSYSGLALARKEGIKYFKEYYAILNGLDIKKYFVVKVYYCCLLIFGYSFCNTTFGKLRSFVKKENA